MTEVNLSTEMDSQTQRTELLPREEGEAGMDWAFRVSRCKVTYTGWISSKALRHSTSNNIKNPEMNHNGKEHENSMYKDITESLC